MSDNEPRIERIEFIRLAEGWHHFGDKCEDCNNQAEFSYGIWCSRELDTSPDSDGALCGACAAVILLQESCVQKVLLEKRGLAVRAVR